MASSAEPVGNQVHRSSCPISDDERAAVLRELESILSSPFFRTSKRSKQFLSYVVQHRLEGHEEPLKERTIGRDLFQRPAGYATGDDPVVRVQAGEVRRRLEQYYHASPSPPPVRIELPVGAYAAEFRWAVAESNGYEPAPVESNLEESTHPATSPQVETSRPSRKHRLVTRVLAGVGIGLVLAAVLIASTFYRASARKSAINQFWSPVLGPSAPVLICLAKPMVYRPSADLYHRYSNSPAFSTESERLSQPPPLQPNDKLVWGDMVQYADYGVAVGDVYAAIQLSALLGRMGKQSQVRIGNNYSFEDLRNFPAIVVGAFNNRWTMQMTSNLHFAFVEENGKQMIREQGQSGRTWYPKFGPHGEVAEDFGVVTRLLNSKTGQFVVAAAGLLADGTQAAGELVSSQEFLEDALRTAPPDWTKKNLQIVVQTTVTDSVPGPPQVVATYVW